MIIATFQALRATVETATGDLYIRWSRGAALDRKAKVSRDYVAGQAHVGLSAVQINADWATDDKWLARRVAEYRFLRLKDARIGCHIYCAKRVGADSDGYDLITEIEPIATVDGNVIIQLVALVG